jgi:hypothetical protein
MITTTLTVILLFAAGVASFCVIAIFFKFLQWREARSFLLREEITESTVPLAVALFYALIIGAASTLALLIIR